MAMLPLVFPLLSAAAPVTALIGTNPPRAYRHGRAPQQVAAPYVTWSVVAGAPENMLSGVPSADSYGVRVDCWSDVDTEVETLAQAVRDAIEPFAHMTGVAADDRDAQTNRYRISLQFEFWVLR
jgi:hypothetical protein